MEIKINYTPENIEQLQENEVFVFGSNENGNHAGGAARVAVEKFGAVMGQAEGMQGQSYAIPTLDKEMKQVSEEALREYIERFRKYADEHKELTFYMTKIGCGIAGFDVEYMAKVMKSFDFSFNVVMPKEFYKIITYKGFDKDMKCRDFQYEVGKTYEEDKAEICNSGFHACHYPLDVFGYYAPANSRFAVVEQDGELYSDNDKVCSTRIKIKTELSLKGIIEAAIKFTFERCKKSKKPQASGYNGAAQASGICGAAQASGIYGAAQASGYKGVAQASGDCGAAQASGICGAAQASGLNSIALAAGYQCKAKGTLGSWIVLTEREDLYGETFPIKEVKAFKVDGVNIKEDTWYKLIYGVATEIE